VSIALLHVSALDGPGSPFGTAFDPRTGAGVDLTTAGYREEEYLVAGTAGRWQTAEPGAPIRVEDGIAYRTRVLVRTPVDPTHSSGIAHVEPLHPHMDAGLSWDALAPHLVRRGDTWVGVTVYPHVARVMQERVSPDRYARLLVPGAGTEWDVFSDVLELMREGRIAGSPSRIVVSGWSATGSFCRVFARERFAVARGGLADAAAVFISSGGAGAAGYPALSPDSPSVPDEDPRRTVRDAGIPVFEILSETESETHRRQLRDDADVPGDTYRLYQIAGAAHIEGWSGSRSTNAAALAAVGVDTGHVPVRERRSDARSDLIARALIDRLVGVLEGIPAPHAERFGYATGDVPLRRMLRRDADGNVEGGIRSPWVEAALASYAPHGTPSDAAPAGAAWTPLADRDLAAGLVGTMTPLPQTALLERYGEEAVYRRRFSDAADDLVRAGFLLPEDADELRATSALRWRQAIADTPSEV
jgi:hypothetical protein